MDCRNTNTTDGLLKVDGFRLINTGGGCTGLSKIVTLKEKELFFLLTDNNLSFPASFPCEASCLIVIDNDMDSNHGVIVNNNDDIDAFIKNVIKIEGVI